MRNPKITTPFLTETEGEGMIGVEEEETEVEGVIGEGTEEVREWREEEEKEWREEEKKEWREVGERGWKEVEEWREEVIGAESEKEVERGRHP